MREPRPLTRKAVCVGRLMSSMTDLNREYFTGQFDTRSIVKSLNESIRTAVHSLLDRPVVVVPAFSELLGTA